MISQSTAGAKQKDILDAALELFVSQGFHGTPTGKIAEKAGVANGTLFHYYKTKDDLVIALYIDIKEKMADFLNMSVSGESSLEQKFRSIFAQSLQWALANKQAFQFVQQFHSSPYLSKIAPEETSKYVQGHLALIAEGINAGLLRNLQPDFIYAMIMGHVFGLFQYLVAGDFSKEKQQEIIPVAFEMLWAMIR